MKSALYAFDPVSSRWLPIRFEDGELVGLFGPLGLTALGYFNVELAEQTFAGDKMEG